MFQQAAAAESSEPTDVLSQPKAFTLRLDFKAFLLPLIQKNRRHPLIALFLVLIHFIEILSLLIRSSSYFTSAGIMPTFHSIISRFNLRYLIPGESLSIIQWAIFVLNIFIFLVLGLSMSNLITELPKKSFLRKSLQTFNLFVFQAYNWLLLVPMLHFSAFTVIQNPYLSVVNMALVTFFGNAIELLEINISFKLEDHLAQTRVVATRLLFNYKIFVSIITGFEFLNELLVLSFFFVSLLEYFRNPNFHSHFISTIYFAGLNFFILASLGYYLIGNGVFFQYKYLDLGYFLFFTGTILGKFSKKLLDWFVARKMERITLMKSGVSTLEFQLYNREIYRHFIDSPDDIDSRFMFLTFFANHQNKCQERECHCKEVQLKNKRDFHKHKKAFLALLKFRFQDYLLTCSENDFPLIFLNFCSFLLTVLKSPAKVLNLLFTHRRKLTNMEDQLQYEILVKRAKKLLEKKLINNDLYAQSLASVIVFDKEVRHAELRLKKIIQDLVRVNELLLSDSQNTSRLLSIGVDILTSLEKFKSKIMILLDRNVKHTRLLQLTALTLKYLTEDLAFRNFYKQLNIKRINHMLMRKSHNALDLFDHDSGVIFITLGHDMASIVKLSKNMLKVLGYNDSNDLLGKDVDVIMPKVFTLRHHEFIKDFVESGKGKFLVSGQRKVFAVTRQGFLVEVKLLIRLDTVFHDEFVVAGHVKIERTLNNRLMVLDVQGNLMNASKDCEILFNFTEKSRDCLINMSVLLPELIEKLFPLNEKKDEKKAWDFKQKGFAVIPIKEASFNDLDISKDMQILSCFDEIKSWDEFSAKSREKLYERLKRVNTQDFRFFRMHYTMKCVSFADKRLDVRVVEVIESFEVNDMRLFAQYLARKTDKLRASLQREQQQPILEYHFLQGKTMMEEEKKEGVKQNTFTQQMESGKQTMITQQIDSNSSNRNDQKVVDLKSFTKNETYTPSSSLQMEEEQKTQAQTNLLKQKTHLNNSKLDPNLNLPPSDIDSQMHVDNLNLAANDNLHPIETSKQSISASFELEGSEFSLGLDNDADFEHRISEISNNMANRLSSDDSLTHQDERTQTYQASQISRVSSHASGDGKKNTISGLMKGGGGKLVLFEMFGHAIFLGLLGVTILFFVLSRQESFNLQRTIGNSGLFHNQLSPVCVLVRDTQAFELFYKGYLDSSEYIREVNKSLVFSAGLLEQAYITAIEQADASMDFIYDSFLTISLENISIFSYAAANGSVLPIYNGINSETYVRKMEIDIPKAILFCLAASQHVLLGYSLDQSQRVSDLENYQYFFNENILTLISSMLQIFTINKGKINDSVGTMTQYNWLLLVLILVMTCALLIASAYITIKNRIKCQRFCLLFWFFQSNDLVERGNKLTSLLDRYFEQTTRVAFEKVSHVTDNTAVTGSVSQTGSTSKLKSLNRSFLRSELKVDKKRSRKLRRSNSLNLSKSWELKVFFFTFLILLVFISGGFIAIYIASYITTNIFIQNTLDIMNDIDSLETYSSTISIRYAINCVILGLYDQTATQITQKTAIITNLLSEIEQLQASITDLSAMFRKTSSSNILTDLKFDFFTVDICEVAETFRTMPEFSNVTSLLGSFSFCENLLKNVLSKGSTSLVFSVNELFDGWQLLMTTYNYNITCLLQILASQEYLDANLALPYVYAIGKYYSGLMQDKTSTYFDGVRNSNIIWIVVAVFVIFGVFWCGFKRLMRFLRDDLQQTFSMIQLFPFALIYGNKVLENKITKMFRMQKI